MKRVALPRAVKVPDRKGYVWAVNPSPGPHPKEQSVPMLVLLRDILGKVKTSREAKKVLSSRLVQVDGVVRTDPGFPVGLMDVVSFPTLDEDYRMVVDWKGRIVPLEIEKEKAKKKTLKVVGKQTTVGGKINLSFHDGRNMTGDNNVKVGDSVTVELPSQKLSGHIKLGKGCRCLIMEGKHAGFIVKLKDIEKRKGGKPSEAIVESEKGGEFVTVADYLFVVEDDFRVSA